jgi:methylase of polypeptide subunit release factors
MKGSGLNNLLIQLGLNEKDSGVIFFKNEEDELIISLPADIQTKLRLIQPDAIYIFNNQPFILFFDLTEEKDLEKESNIHKKVWSFDNSPVVFIIKDADIQIYNALNYIKKDNHLEKIKLSEEERNQRFSFWNLQSGVTWKWLQDEYLNNNRRKETKKRVNEKLFQNIKDVRNALIDRKKDPEGSIPNSLILQLIFIRYLIDRGVKIDERYILGKDLSSQRQCFCNLIQNRQKLGELFAILNDKFNGVLFKEVEITLDDTKAMALAQIFRGEIPEEGTLFHGGDFYFDIFDFSIIPVEVISGIYESLIDPETRDLQAAVYTPAFLAEYILSDTVDDFLKKQNTSECKVFEVAVGSGIFLVQSLRKMIEKEIELNGNDDKKIFSEKIREIATKNLFGVDINEEALKVACFSIYIALLDYQDPKDIDIYRFPNLLNKNLFHADFFNTEHEYNNIIKKIEPHYILGNPPWKKDKSEKHLEWVNKENIYNKKVDGGIEIAQSFLLRIKDFMSSDTKVALIVTSTIFYNVSSTTKIFKDKFLKIYCLDKFFDLSPVRRLIFEEKNSPASIVFFRLSKEDEYSKNVVNHQSVKINYFLKYFKMLVIEKYDRKKIPQLLFIENAWMFKVALYGNVLDFKLLKRFFSNEKKIEDFIDNKSVFGGAGILKGTPKRHFGFLVGLPINENSQINRFYTQNSSHVLSSDEAYLEAGRTCNLFAGTKILIKEQTENETDIVVSYNRNPSVYKKGVFGICSLDENIIQRLYSYFISDIYSYFIFYIAGSWATSTRPQIRWKEEFLSFPFIESDEKTKTELINLVNQFLKPLEDYYKQENRSESLPVNQEVLSKINSIIDSLYGIQGYEKDLINYVLNVSRYQFQESKQQQVIEFTYKKNHYRNRDLVLENYAEVFLNEFEAIYANEFIQVEIYPLEHFIAVNFVFHTEEPENKIIYPRDKKEESNVLRRLANNLSVSQITNATDPSKNLFIQKDIKGFEENSFYVIKPNEYKCWHRAMAWYDVAEFKKKIEEAEFKQSKQVKE